MYKQLQTFSRFLFVPNKVIGGTVYVSAVDNTVVSLLDTLERGILLHFFSSTLICNKKKKRKPDKIVIIISQSLLFSPYSNFRQSRKDQSSPQTSNKYLLKHPVHKILHSQSSCSHRKRNQGPIGVFIVLQIGTCDLQPGELLRLPGYLFLSSKAQWFLNVSTQASAFAVTESTKRKHSHFLPWQKCSAILWSDPQLLNQLVKSSFVLYLGETLTHKQQ